MPSIDLTQQATEDALQLKTRYEDQEQLARRLKLPESFRSDIQPYAAGHASVNTEEFRKLIGRWIRLALEPVQPDQQLEDVQNRLRVRIFFETLMAWDALRDGDAARTRLVAALNSNWQHMAQLLQRPFKEAIAAEIWALDGEFHLEICRSSHLDHLTEVIQVVIADCRSIGAARTPERAEFTLKEHWEIIDAISSGNPQSVFDAIFKHVMEGVLRWFKGMESQAMQIPDEKAESLSIDDWVVRALIQPYDEPPTLGQLSEATFDADLPSLLRTHEGKWVAYLGERQVALEKSRDALVKKCRKICEREKVEYTDLACHRIVDLDFLR